MRVIIPTCDPHLFVLKGFSYFFNKYWGDDFDVTILGFSKPDFELPDNFEFVSMGKEQVGKAKGWSNYVLEYINSIEDEHFIFGIDDFCLARPFDRELYHILESIPSWIGDMGDKIGRIDLQPSLQYARNPRDVTTYKKFEDFEVIELAQRSTQEFIYRITGQFSIWNREYFLKNLKPDWSPHDWELIGGQMAEGDGYKILGTRGRHCVKKVELVSEKQYPNKINVKGMREEDIEKIKEIYADRPEEIGEFKEEWPFENWIDIVYGK